MPVKPETIDRALNAKTEEDRKAAIKAMLREWLVTMPPEEKAKMMKDMANRTVAFMQGLTKLQEASRQGKIVYRKRRKS